MVVLSAPADESTREYLDRTLLLPSLECGIEQILQESAAAAASGSSTEQPLNMLATWLMRHNPRVNPVAASQIQAQRDQRKAREAREATAREEQLRVMQRHREPFQMVLKHSQGEVVLSVDLDKLCADA
jgi:hypothetical protein